ncbi:DeoR family transcriptional regulator [Rhizobium sp. Leaf371]|uniref:DeoR/GlpR family DNA-binding transcription regulator n=1 Tax=Rhizobium sp. Leaf371 TaxID=1736355 RepID=UPI000713ED5D|nr:DeoR/GlpR family DNA-binding transcription regulator [Rhizobium sp. Leaf371]KQS72286.1 DeoR family transcriptional regulator [Rhizobium sp. Leaf371]
MLTSQRHALILDRLRRDGQLVATALAGELGLSEDTIRRDLRELAGAGKLQRVHGGALPVAPPLPDLGARTQIAKATKQALALRAVARIAAGQLVFLDGGSTNEALARALPRDLSITIATHSPTIAAALSGHDAEVILIGGRLYKHSMVATGSAALAAIETMRFDLFFLGATALHPAHGATTGDFEEAAIKRAIAGQSAETFILAAGDKLGAVSPHRILPLAQLTGLVVSADIEDTTLSLYREAGLEILQA